MPSTKAHRAALLHCLADPREVGIEQAHEYFEDGLLVVEDGKVARIGHAAELLPTLAAGTEVVEYPDALITPGFVDTHIHYPQVGVIGSYGAQLLDWLETYTFPNEGRFSDMAHARQQAELFLGELLRNGTTTALVFGTVHKQSVDAFFEACEKRNLRMIAGKVLMDRNAPEFLTDTAESGYADSRELIERWHGKGRLHYAVTPRFAPTSTPEQLTLAGKLFAEFPDLYMHTHISENKQEVEWVKELFPERKGYLDVYDHHGLIGPRSVFAHGIHLSVRPARRCRSVRPPPCSSAAACSTWPRWKASVCASAWAPTSAAAPASRSSPASTRRTRCCSCRARSSTRSRHSISPPLAARGRSIWTTGSATCSRARRPTSWCSTTRRRR